jgi:hypothetical protein
MHLEKKYCTLQAMSALMVWKVGLVVIVLGFYGRVLISD